MNQSLRRIYVVLHSDETTMGTTRDWLRLRRLRYEVLIAPKVSAWPSLEKGDAIVVLGGDMEAWETKDHPWLNDEKRWFHDAIDKNIPIFGVCLGAQLLAEQLGGEVTAGDKWECGWFPVLLERDSIAEKAVRPLTPFHCNSSHYILPPVANRIATSNHFPNQAFRLRDYVGFQFHTEIDFTRLVHILRNWDSSRKGWLQTRVHVFLAAVLLMPKLRRFYFHELDQWIRGSAQ